MATTTKANPAGTSAASPMLVRLHPVAIAGICDAYERRKEKATRVVGFLMGKVDGDVVEVTNCFAVPLDESAQTALRVDIDFALEIGQLNKRANPHEDVVGWYSTRSTVPETSFVLHEFFVRLSSPNAIHLTVDCTTETDRMPIRAYVLSPMGVPQATKDNKTNVKPLDQAALFAQVPVEVFSWDSERVALDLVSTGRFNPSRIVNIPTDAEQVLQTAKLLEDMLDNVVKYVEQVLQDNAPADPEIGRALMDIVGTIPKIDEEAFEKMVNSSRKDVLMVMYLSELAQAQLALQEKVNVLP